MTKSNAKPAAKKDSTSKPLTPTQELMLSPKTTGTLPAPADLSIEQLAAYEEMNDPLREKTLAIRELLNGEVDQLLESEYKLGTLVKEIHDGPKVYGPTSDFKLAKFFGEFGKTKYATARRLRERYEPERFKELMSARGPGGHRLEYTHLALLLRVDDDKADALVNDILAGEWSVKELTSYLKSKAESKPRTGPPRPATFLGLVENIVAVTDQVRKQYQDVWDEGEALPSRFQDLPDEKISAGDVKRVDEAIGLVNDAFEGLKSVAGELAKIKKHMEATLTRRRSGVTTPPEPVEDSPYDDDEDDDEDE
jgi:hypothetical protein